MALTINTQNVGNKYINDKVNIQLTMSDTISDEYQRHLVYFLIDEGGAPLTTEFSYTPLEGVPFTLDFHDALRSLVYTPKPAFSQNVGTVTDMVGMYKKCKVKFIEKTFTKLTCEIEETQEIESNEIIFHNMAGSYLGGHNNQDEFGSPPYILNRQSRLVKRIVNPLIGDFIYIHSAEGTSFTLAISYADIKGSFIDGSSSLYNFSASSPITRVSTYNWSPPPTARYANIQLIQGTIIHQYTIEIYPKCLNSFDLVCLRQLGGYSYHSCEFTKTNFPTTEQEVYINYENGVGGYSKFNKETFVELDAYIAFKVLPKGFNDGTTIPIDDISVYEEIVASQKYFIAVTERSGQANLIEATCSNFDLDTTRGLLKFKLRHPMPYDQPNYHL